MPEAAGYAPLGAVERQRRRALFLQSYQFSVDDDRGRRQEWLGLARRLGGAVARAAGLARAWHGRAAEPLLGCFGSAHHKYRLHGDYV